MAHPFGHPDILGDDGPCEHRTEIGAVLRVNRGHFQVEVSGPTLIFAVWWQARCVSQHAMLMARVLVKHINCGTDQILRLDRDMRLDSLQCPDILVLLA